MLATNPKNPLNLEAAVHDPEKLEKFGQVIKDIQANNKGKDVILAVGSMERDIFNYLSKRSNYLDVMGLKEITADEIKAMGIKDQKILSLLDKKVWRLET